MGLSGTDIVRTFWACLQARHWTRARALLHDDATMHWASSGEHFDNADAIIRVQVIYPEGWSIKVISVDEHVSGDVHSLVEVTQGAMQFFANSRFRLEAGSIRAITEYWATFEAPPDWRSTETIGAYRRDTPEATK